MSKRHHGSSLDSFLKVEGRFEEAQVLAIKEAAARTTVPNEVVNLSFERGVSPMAAWREHFGLTQVEVAACIGITQAAYARMERVKQPRKPTLEKVAEAMGLNLEQLRW